MKTIFKLSILSLMIFLLNSCQSQYNIGSEKVDSLLQSREFTFTPERVNLDRIPNAATNNFYNVGSDNNVIFENNELYLYLPYVGKTQVAMFNSSQNRIKFVSKNYTMTEAAGKKGSKVYSIRTPDQPNILLMTLEVFKNGRADLYINASDRSPISYDGYITENLVNKYQAKN